MPELPEVQTVVNSLIKKVINKQIIDYNSLWHKVCYNKISNIDKSVKNNTVEKVFRLGKHIVLKVDSAYLIFHLRMTGYLYYSRIIPQNKKHLRCYFIFSDNSYLLFEDIRKFGGFYFYKNLNPLKNKIGIDPFDSNFTFGWLKSNILNKKATIKSLLLNQKFICGLGNIYIDEILWKSRIKPSNIAHKISAVKIKILHTSIIEVLKESILLHGTTKKNFKFDNMKTGNYKEKLNVYGRKGMECKRCNKNIITITKINGRTTHFCSKCQR